MSDGYRIIFRQLLVGITLFWLRRFIDKFPERSGNEVWYVYDKDFDRRSERLLPIGKRVSIVFEIEDNPMEQPNEI